MALGACLGGSEHRLGDVYADALTRRPKQSGYGDGRATCSAPYIEYSSG